MAAAARRRLGHSFEYLGHVESDETVWLAARRRRLADGRVPRGQGVEEHRAARAAPAVARRRARARTPRRRARCAWKKSRPTTRSSRPSPASATRRSGAPTAAIKDIYACGLAGHRGPLRRARAGRAARAGQRRARHAVRARSPAALRPGAARGGSGARGARGGQRQPAPAGGRAAPPRSAPKPPRPSLDPTAEVTGRGRCARCARSAGIELGDIAQRTKISERYLRAIEEEQLRRHAGRRLRARLRHGVRARAAPRPAAGDRKLPGALPREAAEARRRRGRRPPNRNREGKAARLIGERPR